MVMVMPPPPSPPPDENVMDGSANTTEQPFPLLGVLGVGELAQEALDLLALLLLRSGCCHRHDGEKAKCENDELHFAAWSSEGAESLK